jgi:nucleoside-diphosphate-sugar epimerase
MRAAVAHDVRRVVQTGPLQTLLAHPAGYDADGAILPDVPARPGDNLYFVTKLLGQEVCRIFAEEHALEVPTLLFCNFVDPAASPSDPADFFPFAVSWADAGEAMRQAVRVPGFPGPFELLHVNADLPHGRYPNDKAKRCLAWQPRDRLEAFWMRGETRGAAARPGEA